MNISEGTEVYAIYRYGDNNEWYDYRKERFIRYQNGQPVCTFNMMNGASMGYEEICSTEKEAQLRVSILSRAC